MNWPHGMQWEWAIGDFALLAFLIWQLVSVRRSLREDREKASREAAEAAKANEAAGGSG
jgi:hypothetical protein